jgi:hypothetical protein
MMTPDYILGDWLATTPDEVLQAALAERPVMLALLHRLNEIIQSPPHSGGLDAFLNPAARPNPNERQLCLIVAPTSHG